MWNKITVHCSASKNGEHCSRETIETWHKNRGYSEIGYNFLIEPDGTIIQGRSLEKESCHVEGANKGNIGICLVGTHLFKVEQFFSLRILIDQLRQKYKIKKWDLHTHNQFPSAIKQGKTCPNIGINKLLAWYLLNDNDVLKDNILTRNF